MFNPYDFDQGVGSDEDINFDADELVLDSEDIDILLEQGAVLSTEELRIILQNEKEKNMNTIRDNMCDKIVFDPPYATPENPQPLNECRPSNLDQALNCYQESEAQFYYTRIIRKHMARAHVAFSMNSMTMVLRMLRHYHVSYEVLADADTIFSFTDLRTSPTTVGAGASLHIGTVRFTWKGSQFIATQVSEKIRATPSFGDYSLFIGCDNFDALAQINCDLYLYTPDTKDRILLYRGDWTASSELRKSIVGYGWDDVVLPSKLKDEIRFSTEQFFSGNRDVYKRLGIPHKRGFLFVGEPGSGKSLVAKVLANTQAVSFIYVLSLKSTRHSVEDSLVEIYREAGKNAPSIVLFEDLDTLIDDNSRTVFLNILDGFAANDGILTIGTTNHPGNIDVALLNRPSRFDRKFVFPNPDSVHRGDYLTDRVKRVLGDGFNCEIEELVREIGVKTRGYSCAMLQELVLTAATFWAHAGMQGDFMQFMDEAYILTLEQTNLGAVDKLESEMHGSQKSVGFRGDR